MAIIFLIMWIVLSVLMCFQESKKRKINFVVALLICLILSPIIGYFIISSRPLRNALYCPTCSNTKSERLICGVCGSHLDAPLQDIEEIR
jgi:multisubunit Na+/H+ antiporter MnhG subunit